MMNETYVVPTPTSTKVKDGLWKSLKILYIAIVLLLMYLPVLFIIILSFNDNKLGTEFTGFTFDYYFQMFEKEHLTSAIVNTLSISILSTVISTVLGTLFAIGINALSKKQRHLPFHCMLNDAFI